MDFGGHENLFRARAERGDIVLVLGAGASAGSNNRYNKPIVTGNGLAKVLCEEMGEPYANEALGDVASAFEHLMGRDALNKVLIREFRYTKPSDELSQLFRYTWKRIYTWNYDDSILEAARGGVQRNTFYNGMSDAVEEIPQITDLQIVFLHGQITKLDSGIILTNEDYANILQSSGHDWYRKITNDYRISTVVFVGASLTEPILAAELERASRHGLGASGAAFLITPDTLSGVRRSALAKRGIIHIQASLQELVAWLSASFGADLPPSRIVTRDRFFNESNIGRFSLDDVAAAQSIRPIDANTILSQFEKEGAAKMAAAGRAFLIGFPPSWGLASSPIPVRLKQLGELETALVEASASRADMFVTVGQAGSGKSTATMQALLDLSKRGDVDVFELDPSVSSVGRALDVLARLSSKPKFVFLGNLFVYGASLVDDFPSARKANVTFVATARSSEWKEYFEKHFSSYAKTFQFQRFVPADYDPLIERLKAYVPAPTFVKLSHDKQVERLSKSKSQLLIALREATESGNFDDVIIDEYRGLSSDDVRELFIIIGIGTLARVGVDPATAAEAYATAHHRSISFEAALEKLEGIVAPVGGRLVARHEFYVRNILDRAAHLDVTLRLIQSLLSTFTKYEIPITKHVTRSDAALFRFLLNHGFLRERSERGGDKYAGLELYRNFEVEFQLDGHFWLQYGLYYQRLGNSELAAEMLEKSIQAFPGNAFAIHALASERLLQAKNRSGYDGATRRLIDMAVSELEKLHANPYLSFDQYPLVTLARLHIPVLIRHNQIDKAVDLAKDYYERLRVMEKSHMSPEITDAKAKVLKFATSRIWEY